MEYFNNTSYIFIPFTFNSQEDFRPLISTLGKSGNWEQIHDEITYMLRYVADKIDSADEKNCQCFHYEIKPSAREKMGIADENEWYSLTDNSDSSKVYRFRILSAQLYCFRTTVSIIAFRVYFENNDPMQISNALYLLKKVSRAEIVPSHGGEPTTLLDISKHMVSEFENISSFDFFYYSNRSTERANVLTFLEAEPKDSYNRELFYLRRCYSDGFVYVENEKSDSEEIFSTTQGIVWGVSPEAAVCLANDHPDGEEFIRRTFYPNFNAQYLFMYVLLLHQKYVLYMFLMKIGVGTYNNLKVLEEYRDQLYEFETDFVFSCVTEVPQYQTLYDKTMQAFSLKQMYEDVHKPLVSLGEVRMKKRDDSVNKALLLLSILCVFSALVDSFDFISSFGGWFAGADSAVIKAVQISFMIVILIITVLVIKLLVGSKKE